MSVFENKQTNKQTNKQLNPKTTTTTTTHRLIGIRCGVNETRTGAPAASAKPCSISGMWRWLPTP